MVAPSNSFLALLNCLQFSDNDFGGGDVSRDVLYEPRDKLSLFKVVIRYTKRHISSI